MWHYLAIGMAALAVGFGGNVIGLVALVELANAEQQPKVKPPRGGHRRRKPMIALILVEG